MDGSDDGGGVCRGEPPGGGGNEDGAGACLSPSVRRKLALQAPSEWLDGGDLPLCLRDPVAMVAMAARSHCRMGVRQGHPGAAVGSEARSRAIGPAGCPGPTVTVPYETRACFYRVFFALAAAYNVAFAVWTIVWPRAFFDLFGMDPPRYPAIWQCLGMVVGVYALG